jgi:hypothetical protein
MSSPPLLIFLATSISLFFPTLLSQTGLILNDDQYQNRGKIRGG